ncbi:MAG: mRNA surveillance protein pelota [Thermoplasmatota archaeon]
MKIIFKDLHHGQIKLVAENLDDIWHLYNIIEEGDIIKAVMFRTEEHNDDRIRSKKAEKKPMKIALRVEKVNFHEFSDRLRVQGIIEEAPQDVGSYHTYNIEAESMNSFTILKDEWKSYQLDRLEEAVKQRTQSLLVFVSLDEDTATIAVLRQSGIQHVADITSKRSGKMYESKETTHEYFGDIISILKSTCSNDYPLIVIGPGFTREHFVSYGKTKEPSLFSNCQTHATAHAEMTGIHEALKIGIVEQITKNNRVSYETQNIEKLFEEIKKDGLATYGKDEVFDALEKGAVQRLLISDIMVRSKQGEKYLELARKTHSDFIIINSMHDAGRKFEGLGGLGALLRFKV